jgi:hypothetical protein
MTTGWKWRLRGSLGWGRLRSYSLNRRGARNLFFFFAFLFLVLFFTLRWCFHTLKRFSRSFFST